MSEQFKIEIEKGDEMIHQGEIFDSCSIGGDKNHYYQSSGLQNNELLIKEVGGIYNIISKSSNWTLNGKSILENKFYLLGKKNKLKFGKYKVIIKKIKDNSSGGLELEGEKQSVKDLIGSSSKNIYESVDIYNSKEKNSAKKIEQNFGYINRLGLLGKISSNLFNITLFYLITWILIPILQNDKLSSEFKSFKGTVLNLLASINQKFVKEDGLHIFQSSLSQFPQGQKFGVLIDQLFFKLLIGFLFFCVIRVAFSLIFGRPLTFLFLGINLDGNFVTKRIKSSFLEILNPVMMPLNIHKLWGILPFRSIPEILLRIVLFRSSKFLGLSGPIFLFFASSALVLSPLIYLISTNQYDLNSASFKNRKPKLSSAVTHQVVFNQESFSIVLDPSFRIEKIGSKNGGVYKITGSKLHKSIVLRRSDKPLTTGTNNFSKGNPLAFINYPVHALKNINFDIPSGNSNLFIRERTNMLRYSLSLLSKNHDPMSFLHMGNDALITVGPFLAGTLFMTMELKERLNLLQGQIRYNWMNFGDKKALYLTGDKNSLLTFPLEKNTSSLIFSAIKARDMVLLTNNLAKNQSVFFLPIKDNSLISEILPLIENLSIEDLLGNTEKMFKPKEHNFMKNMQKDHKELTNSIKKASKDRKKMREEIDSE